MTVCSECHRQDTDATYIGLTDRRILCGDCAERLFAGKAAEFRSLVTHRETIPAGIVQMRWPYWRLMALGFGIAGAIWISIVIGRFPISWSTGLPDGTQLPGWGKIVWYSSGICLACFLLASFGAAALLKAGMPHLGDQPHTVSIEAGHCTLSYCGETFSAPLSSVTWSSFSSFPSWLSGIKFSYGSAGGLLLILPQKRNSIPVVCGVTSEQFGTWQLILTLSRKHPSNRSPKAWQLIGGGLLLIVVGKLLGFMLGGSIEESRSSDPVSIQQNADAFGMFGAYLGLFAAQLLLTIASAWISSARTQSNA